MIELAKNLRQLFAVAVLGAALGSAVQAKDSVKVIVDGDWRYRVSLDPKKSNYGKVTIEQDDKARKGVLGVLDTGKTDNRSIEIADGKYQFTVTLPEGTPQYVGLRQAILELTFTKLNPLGIPKGEAHFTFTVLPTRVEATSLDRWEPSIRKAFALSKRDGLFINSDVEDVLTLTD